MDGLRGRTTLAITSRKAAKLKENNQQNDDDITALPSLKTVKLNTTITEIDEKRTPFAQQSNQNSDLLVSWRRILMLIMAVTVHNFPEGLAVGIGFGSIGKTPAATFEKAFNLALGIGLQNFPEGYLN
jgi:zinc transporter ZupT